jgi:hypothetical protein
LSREKTRPERKVLRKNDKGYFHFEKIEPKTNPKRRTNYFAYSRRAIEIMNEPKIEKQLKKHKNMFHAAMAKHLKNNN